MNPNSSQEHAALLVLTGFAVVVILFNSGCVRNPQATNQQSSANVTPTALPSASNTTNQAKEDKGVAPTIQITSASSRTNKLGDPMEVSGTLSNPNDFAIANVKVTLMHMDVGENKEVVLFENKPAPAKATVPWKVSVTFEQGHPPEALLSLLDDWKKAQ